MVCNFPCKRTGYIPSATIELHLGYDLLVNKTFWLVQADGYY